MLLSYTNQCFSYFKMNCFSEINEIACFENKFSKTINLNIDIFILADKRIIYLDQNARIDTKNRF